MYEIKDKKEKKGFAYFILFLSLFLFLVTPAPRHSNKKLHDNSKHTLTPEETSNHDREERQIYSIDLYERLKDANTSEHEIIKTYNSPLGKFRLKAGNKEHYGLRHILARHTRNYFPDYNKAQTLFDDHITPDLIVGSLDYFVNYCVEVYLQKKDPYDESRGVCLGYIIHKGHLIRCLLVYRKSDKSIITFYPLTKENELEMLESRSRRYQD